MAAKAIVPMDKIALASRLRSAAEMMTQDNFHDWAFLATLAADALIEMGDDAVDQRILAAVGRLKRQGLL